MRYTVKNIHIKIKPSNKIYLFFRPNSKLVIIVIRLVKDNHAVGDQFQALQKVLVVHLGSRDFDKSSNRLNCIDQHMHFQSPFLLPVTLGVTANTLEDITEQADGRRIDQKNLLEGQPEGSAVRQK